MADQEQGKGSPGIGRSLSRRELLKRGIELGLAAPAISALLAACTSAPPSPTSAPPAAKPAPAGATSAPAQPTAAAEQPRRGGWLVAYNSTGPRTLDPNQENNIIPLQSIGNVFDTLVRYDAKKLPKERVLVGSLATSWTVSPDLTEVTFRLRQGVTFHDGRPLTSADVKATMDRIQKPPQGVASPLSGVFKDVTVAVPDPSTVVMKYPTSFPLAVEIFVHQSLSIVPAHIVTADPRGLEQKPIGTGPFKFSAWQKGASQEFVRYEAYWDKGKPYLDGIRFLDMPEPAAQLAAFRTGQVNMTGFGARGLSPSDVATIKQAVPGALIQDYFAPTQAFIIMNNKTAPFSNPKVRQAVALTVDQQEVINLGMDGAGYKTDFMGPIGQTWSMSADVLNQQPVVRGVTQADRDRAKALLAEAGHPQGIDVELLVADLYQAFAPVVIDQLAKIGIRATSRVVPFGPQFIPDTRAGKYQIAYATVPGTAYDPTLMLNTFTTGFADNRMGYSNAEVDGLYKSMYAATDAAQRKRLSDQLQTILWRELPAIPAPLLKYYFALRPEVQGWTHPGLLKDNMRYEELWLRSG